MLAQVFIWLVLFEILWYGNKTITDTPIYYDYASRMVNGLMPYRDFASEYPPVAMLLFLLPRLLSGSGYSVFVFWFQVEMLLFNLGITILLAGLAWRQWQSPGKVAGTLSAYTIFLLALGSIVETRFDMAAAFVILASLACFITDRYLGAWLLLGVGIMTKVVPVLIAPLYLIVHYRRRQQAELWMGPLAMLLAAIIISIPFLITAPAGLANSFLYHWERPLQLESTWSSPLLLATRFSNYQVQILNSYGSHNVYSSLSNTLSTISGPMTIVLLSVGYWVFCRREYSRGPAIGPSWDSSRLIRFAAVAVATFIFAGKVFSPQFLIWLIPLLPLVKGADRRLLFGVFTTVLLLTQWEFPYKYWELYMLQKSMIVEVAVRNTLLGALVVLMIIALGEGRQQVQHEGDTTPRSAASLFGWRGHRHWTTLTRLLSIHHHRRPRI